MTEGVAGSGFGNAGSNDGRFERALDGKIALVVAAHEF